MKNNTFLIVIMMVFNIGLVNLNAQNQSPDVEYSKLKTQVENQQRVVDELNQRFNDELKPITPIPIKYLPIWITLMTFIITIFLAIATYQSFVKVKEAKEQLAETRKMMDKMEQLFEKSELKIDKAEGKVEKSEALIAETREKTDTVLREGKLLLDKFNDISSSKVRELDNTIRKARYESLETLEKIEYIEKKIINQHNYLYQSIEHHFYLFQAIAEVTKDQGFLKRQYLSRGVTQIYSEDKDDRLSGIRILGFQGRQSDIKHLEKVIVDPDESDVFKLLATKAIHEILSRTKAF